MLYARLECFVVDELLGWELNFVILKLIFLCRFENNVLQSYSESLIDLKLFVVSFDEKLFGILLFGFPNDLNLIYNVCHFSSPFSQLRISLCIQILN